MVAPARAPAHRDDAAGDRARPARHRARRSPPPPAARAAAATRPRGDRDPRRAVRDGRARTSASRSTTSARATWSTCRASASAAPPITNATFLHFVEGGGYQRREWWSDEGWAWKEEYDITHPAGWAAGPDGWRQWRVDGRSPLHPEEPVVHVSWFEADAFARAHGARLPTEAEWEKAATWAQEPLQDVGDTWEWTATEFDGYPGFRRPPVPRVLRGVLPRGLPRPARRLVGDPRARARRRPSATGTSPSAARSSPACDWPGT